MKRIMFATVLFLSAPSFSAESLWREHICPEDGCHLTYQGDRKWIKNHETAAYICSCCGKTWTVIINE
jgi:hypothetical protein